MASDVPVGVFLSGGLDSTSIVRSMFAEGLDIRSFSVGFEGFDLNELPYANKIVASCVLGMSSDSQVDENLEDFHNKLS